VNRSQIIRIVLLAVLFLGYPRLGLSARTECSNAVAKIVSIEGRVESLFKGDEDWQSSKINDLFCPGDKVRTLGKSRALLLRGDSTIRLDQKTVVKFSVVNPTKNTLLELVTGKAFFRSRFFQKLTIETPFVNAASEGTEFLVFVDEKQETTTITVLEGRITADNGAGSTLIKHGESAVSKMGEKPVARTMVRPRDAIQWALYYPPVLKPQKETDALDLTRAYVDKAGDLLSFGRVDEAKAEIAQGLNISPSDGRLLALQTMMAVVQDDKEKALLLAHKAIALAPYSASARMALSYAYQANFNLSEALKAAQEAVLFDPKNALIWSRLAELWMSEGNLDQALDSAEKAVAIDENEARAHTVLGFSYLMQIKIEEAKKAFEKATLLNQADPLPHLGIGLAMIRNGDLEGGRQEIEIATGLDPNNALIRSYLGKGYYEEKSNKLAEEQFTLAKQLDPKDPTPWFYDAIRKQTINQPIVGLYDLQKSIALNDNRAVYRSRLLLDEDLSARSVSLSRIYSDLGFQQLALNAGWESIHTDPSNYSAHRLLADSYLILPRSEIARDSALLMAQLLQPININPVQPKLGGSSILSGAGAGNASFGELNPLFMRDRNQLLVSGIAGGNNTLGEEVILTGLKGRYSYSLGQSHQKTAGFRENAGINETFYNAFLQMSLSHKTNIQGEFRSADVEEGDTELRFDPTAFSPTKRKVVKTTTSRLGLHHRITPRSDFVASFLYQKVKEDQNDSSVVSAPSGFSVDAKVKDKGFSNELQYLFRTERLNLTTGIGQVGTDLTDVITTTASPMPPFASENSTHHKHTNFYLYSMTKFPFNTTLLLGGSGDVFESNTASDGTLSPSVKKKQFNPKFGLIWNPISSTTLRLAGFRVLKRDLVSHQTIEPTQVAGFQQLFDDPDGSDAKRYGMAIDQRLSSSLFYGLELSKRDVSIPIVDITIDPPALKRLSAGERLHRAYLYWTPNSKVAITAEYEIERFDSEDATNSFGPKIKTARAPLGLNFFHPHGFFTSIKAMYVTQEGTFLNVSSGNFEHGNDQFLLLDVAGGYRFSKQNATFTVGARNLRNEKFKFQQTSTMSTFIQPKQLIFAKLTLLF